MSDIFLGTYNPKEVTLSVGALLISGYSDGTFIKAALSDPDLYKVHVGSHGEVARTKNNNKMGYITITLKQTSPSNAKLDLLKNSPTPVPVLLKNNSDSKFIATAANGWVSKDPDQEFGAEESKVEWIIACDELVKSNI
jgi:hypothetical protein